MDRVRIATRRSALALWQANHVRDLLLEAHPGLEVELVKIVTKGDRILDRPLSEIGGKGLFLKELEVSMLDGESDLAVHSMKDMPAEDTPGLVLQAALPRANPFDAWLCLSGKSLEELPAGARVGTSSLRRGCQVRAVRPDLEVVELRGNVDTRLAKLDAGEYDAIILAAAGLERLGWGDRITARLAPPDWLPAGTQGIIGLQCRAEDEAMFALLEPLADEKAMRQARAERTVLAALQGSCQVPLAVYAEPQIDGGLVLTGMVGTPDGRTVLRAEASGTEPEAIGLELAELLKAQGAEAIIASLAHD
jgi:hydroxymethylbilane synthase